MKCSECGNTFKPDVPSNGDVVACPMCEAEYKAVVQDGRVRFVAFIYEGKDYGEL